MARFISWYENQITKEIALPPARIENSEGVVFRENRNFWNGNLPQQIVEMWNFGRFDNSLKELSSSDISYIVENAPRNFSAWALRQKYINIELMKTDSDALVRRMAYSLTKDFSGMKSDTNPWLRAAGYAITRDLEGMKNDNELFIRNIGENVLKYYDQALAGRSIPANSPEYSAMQKLKDISRIADRFVPDKDFDPNSVEYAQRPMILTLGYTI